MTAAVRPVISAAGAVGRFLARLVPGVLNTVVRMLQAQAPRIRVPHVLFPSSAPCSPELAVDVTSNAFHLPIGKSTRTPAEATAPWRDGNLAPHSNGQAGMRSRTPLRPGQVADLSPTTGRLRHGHGGAGS